MATQSKLNKINEMIKVTKNIIAKYELEGNQQELVLEQDFLVQCEELKERITNALYNKYLGV